MVNKNNAPPTGWLIQVRALVRGVLGAFILLIILSIILALAVSVSSWQPTVRILSALVHAAVFIGALLAGRSCEQKAWLHGILVGVLAFLLLSFMGFGESFLVTWLWWRRLGRMIFVAMLGGIVGGLFDSH